jgi:mono/diheme cytochrome c family protein
MKRFLIGLVLGVLALAALVWFLNVRGEDRIHDVPPPEAPIAQQVARGAYLARVGNCAGCHTDRGGAAYAGGRGIETPFGVVYSSNLTSDQASGIGGWSADSSGARCTTAARATAACSIRPFPIRTTPS